MNLNTTQKLCMPKMQSLTCSASQVHYFDRLSLHMSAYPHAGECSQLKIMRRKSHNGVHSLFLTALLGLLNKSGVFSCLNEKSLTELNKFKPKKEPKRSCNTMRIWVGTCNSENKYKSLHASWVRKSNECRTVQEGIKRNAKEPQSERKEHCLTAGKLLKGKAHRLKDMWKPKKDRQWQNWL